MKQVDNNDCPRSHHKDDTLFYLVAYQIKESAISMIIVQSDNDSSFLWNLSSNQFTFSF